MKRIGLYIISLFLTLTISAQVTTRNITVTNSGGTITIQPSVLPQFIVLSPVSGGTVLSNNFSIDASAVPPVGTEWWVYILSEFDLNGHTFQVFGQDVKQFMLQSSNSANWVFHFWSAMDNGTSPSIAVFYTSQPYDLNHGQSILGNEIIDGTLSLSAIDTVGAGRILIGNRSNQLSSVTVGGDISINSSGTAAITAGSIVNADINASAAIARTKLANGNANQVVINNGSGVLSSEATLSPVRGGLGTDASAANGFTTFDAGTASIGALTLTRDLHVSFTSDGQGTYYLTFPSTGTTTVTNVEVRVEDTLAGTDTATVTIQNNSGTAMAGNNLSAGRLALAPSATTGTGYTSTLTSNNTFTTGQRMRLITAKTTAGGTANIQVTYTILK